MALSWAHSTVASSDIQEPFTETKTWSAILADPGCDSTSQGVGPTQTKMGQARVELLGSPIRRLRSSGHTLPLVLSVLPTFDYVPSRSATVPMRCIRVFSGYGVDVVS